MIGLRARIALIATGLFAVQSAALLVLNRQLFTAAVTDVQRNQAGVLRDSGELDRCAADPGGWSMVLDGGFRLYAVAADGSLPHPTAPRVQVSLRDEPGACWGAQGGSPVSGSVVIFDTGQVGPCRYLLTDRSGATVTSRGLVGFWGGVRIFLGIVIVPAIVLLTAGPLVRRIRRLSASAHDIVASDFRGRLPEGQGDELDALAADFNRVAEEAARRIDELRRRDARLTTQLANLAHDVRTPLAALKLGLGRSDPARLTAARAEVEYLDGLFANLARGIQLEASGIPLSSEQIDLSALTERVVQRFTLIAEDRGITLHSALPPGVLTATGDSIAVEQAVGNLVHNAVKYAAGNVAVLLYAEGEEAIFEVRDDGPGFPEAELPRLTERSYRGREQSGRTGLGLGLAIARYVAEHSGGRLTLARDEEEGGSIATLALPAQ